ncbi:hypothetical protein PAESOLCIP111_00347 [Paenibacillus solanacearum]|uniref:Aminoglycoside phosphotransferase domain-containing protein n=1 Tax=Paenibacillus solanacearum TaxID=2048548 RepID=A0A916JSN0_9BACL|nr:aminoglycoside phosphotransferase family protein [Paenibacillus solanacearum]CAG7599874.1 hypothetical protein PAESOLCIP111_00347 [Paenibacillus solanacearum]
MNTMNPWLSNPVLEWVIDAVHPEARVASVERLHGGISALVCRIVLSVHGEERSVVLRLFTNAEWVREQPDLALREAASLRRASRASGTAVPQLIAFDETGERCGVPALLMTRLEGLVVLDPPDIRQWVDGMAEALSRLHQVDAADHGWSFTPYCDAGLLDTSSWSQFPGKWREAARIVTGDRPSAASRFIHRDYHPANVLWKDGEVSGVVDWVNGCIGPAGIDVGHCRVNLAQLHGIQAADAFLSAYRQYAGDSFAYDPYWDLVTLIDFAYWPPEVYKGWTDLGFTGLTTELVAERLDLYLLSILDRVSS